MPRSGRAAVGAACALSAALAGEPALADETLTFDGSVTEGGLDHEFIEFDVPAGTQEIQVDHDDLSPDDILDWGLNDPNGFRGWGGGNSEPAIVGELAASRSYLAGPLPAGKWRVVIGKAQIQGGSADYHVVVTLRDAPTLAPQPERAPYEETAPLSTEERFYAGDLHAHSRESGDAGPTIAELVTFARSQGLDFVELSEHNTVSQLDFIAAVQKEHPDILIVPGVEYTTYAGHANGIGATTWVDHKIGQPGVDIAGAAADFRAQGALFSINHPLLDIGDACIGCGWKHDLPVDAIDAVEIATAGSASILGQPTIAYWEDLLDTGRHVSIVAGSDDHTAGEGEGSFATPVGTPATYVFAKGLSVPSLLEGIRNSRTVVKIGGVTDPMVELTSDVPREGDTIFAEETTLRARITGADGLRVVWVHDGETLEGLDVVGDPFDTELRVKAPAQGQARYRVQVMRGSKPATITGHVWLEFKAGVGVPEETGETAGDAEGGCACRAGSAPYEGAAGRAGLLAAVGILGVCTVRRRRRDARARR